MDEKQWQAAVKGFSILKPLFELDKEQQTRVHVEKMAKILNSHSSCHLPLDPKHMKTRSALSVLLRNGRSDRGGIRVSNEVDAVIQAAIKKIYLVVEQSQITAVIEEVNLQCFKAKLKRPGASTVRQRIENLSERLN